MELGEALERLGHALEELPELRKLRYDDAKFDLWRDKVSDILELAFGRDSEEYDRFKKAVTAWVLGLDEAGHQQEYLRHLGYYETALKSILQRLEVRRTASKPKPTAEAMPPKDSAELTNYLFDNMQFHPRVIEASKSLFETQHYAQAIFEAFKAVDNLVKEKTGLSLSGKQLMAQVFREEQPTIKLNEGRSQSDRDEQEGFKFLFMGAMVGIRNPKAHDNVVQTDPYRTLEYLGFASLLMRRIEEGEVTPP